MSGFRCVIFDMDGTLTQTNRLIFDAFNHIAMRYEEKTYTEQEITAMFGPPEEGALLRIVDDEQLDAAMGQYLDFYRSNHARLAWIYPGIEEILQFLKDKGCKLAVFTGKGTHTTRITLEEFRLSGYFDLVVTGNDVVNHKPSAEGIRKILSHFSLAPEEVLMVGDSVADVKASREAGVKVASVLWDSYAREKVLKMNADYLFERVEEFGVWLKREMASPSAPPASN